MSWPGVALRTMPYPDITLVGLGVDCAWRIAPMKMTSQPSKIRQITPSCPKFNYILKNADGKYSNPPCMCQTGK